MRAVIHETGLKYIKGNTISGKPCLQVWQPKALKPFINYCYHSIEDRDKALEKAVNQIIEWNKRKEQYKQERKIDASTITLKKGDIFYTSWGYDQTNYDFIVVLSVKGLYATCQRTHVLNMGHTSQCDVLEPIFMGFGDVFKMKIGKGYQGEFSLRGSYPYCNDGTGSKRLHTFSLHKEGSQYHQTDCYSGH